MEKFDDIYGEYRVVFAAEPFCWPRKELAPNYPLVRFGKRFLNSGLFMGYAPEIWRIINEYPVDDKDDDQLYYTNIYLDEKLRNSLKISLDSMSYIFQNLNGVKDDIALEFDDNGDAHVTNVPYNTHPIIIHGNGPSKLFLNYLANYIGKTWSAQEGCLFCENDKLVNLKDIDEKSWPSLTLAIFIAKPIPFIREFLNSVEKFAYPFSKIDVYLYNNQKYNEKDVDEFVRRAGERFRSIHVDNVLADLNEREARSLAVEYAMKMENEFLLVLDGDVHLTNIDTIRILVETASALETGILAPLVVQPERLFSNFWGALSDNGYYARSEDYVDIVKSRRVGIWNVPFVSSIFLISKSKFDSIKDAFSYNSQMDVDMSFCEFARHSGHFMYVDNRNYYGFLVVNDDFDTSKLHPEMYQIFDNRDLWESRYIHEKYFDAIDGKMPIGQPCQDVFDFPLMSEEFCSELIEEMEHYGEWSSGSNQDERLAGGYENVPTRDIHMNQIGFERHWLYMLDEYVRPMQEKIFIGYYQQPVQSSMMFVVRYKPEEQSFLRPHHDASTYSIDVALNKRGVDYQGGGVRYVRYNCTVDADKVG
ncbi:unnamed protein product [Toxocara canis]|uniref:Prolyl 4-hydroxylase alpha subunit domain-containing protein n=1 Tax=Toxocara canis TaxID=6265 RepID=A0A3P7H454_TOXCA|nr:unnamed protein product [Toxocara canis]